MRATLLLLGLPLVSAISNPFHIGHKVSQTDCIFSCKGVLDVLTFGDYDPKLAKKRGGCAAQALSPWYATSLLACLDEYCSSSETTVGWEENRGQCAKYYGTPDFPSIDAVRPSMPAELPVVTVNRRTVYNQSFLISEQSFGPVWRTKTAYSLQMFWSHTFGDVMYIFVLALALIGQAMRWSSWYMHRQPADKPSMRGEAAPAISRWVNAQTAYEKHLGMPALGRSKHSTPVCGFFSIPTRVQGLLIFVYIVLNIVFCAVGYDIFDENTTYPNDTAAQICRYVSDRTGVLSFWNLPLLWVLAGRNDIVQWLSGWSYSSMNLMHRWVARVATLQAIVHSIGYLYIGRESLPRLWARYYWRTGCLATIFMVVMIPLSVLPFRKHYYEIFLLLHIVFAIGTLSMCYYHIEEFDLKWKIWCEAAAVIWGFDRFVRLVRLQVLSYNAIKDNNATAELTGGDNGLIRLSVNTPFKINPKPGDYYFLYNPISLTPWESHPFTLASWEQGKKSTRLNFLIAVKSGATKRLKRKIKANPTKMRVLLEGPYGTSEPLEQFDHVLFVAGGSGITAILPYLHKLRDVQSIKSMSVVWAVKNNAYASDVLRRELAQYGIEVNLHITEEEKPAMTTLTEGPSRETLVTAAAGANEKHTPEDKSSSDGSVVTISVGRPDMATSLQGSIKRLVGSERLAVLVCGPEAMTDDMRKAVVNSYGSNEGQVSGSTIEYFEESFTW